MGGEVAAARGRNEELSKRGLPGIGRPSNHIPPRLRDAIRSRRALSLMKPSASFWS